jgi:D-lactate dehydrogenase (cytochrome)
MTSNAVREELVKLLTQRLGGEGVLADERSRSFYSNDIFWQPGIPPHAIALPKTAEEAAEAVQIATGLGVAVVPRGGGMSYTKGYLPARPDSIVIDARRMNRVVEVNAADMYLTAEAGCTWADVHAALEGTGLRPPTGGRCQGAWQPSAAHCHRTAPSSALRPTAPSPRA